MSTVGNWLVEVFGFIGDLLVGAVGGLATLGVLATLVTLSVSAIRGAMLASRERRARLMEAFLGSLVELAVLRVTGAEQPDLDRASARSMFQREILVSEAGGVGRRHFRIFVDQALDSVKFSKVQASAEGMLSEMVPLLAYWVVRPRRAQIAMRKRSV